MTDIDAIRARHQPCDVTDIDGTLHPHCRCHGVDSGEGCDTAVVLAALDLECGVRSSALDELVEMQARLDAARADAKRCREGLKRLVDFISAEDQSLLDAFEFTENSKTVLLEDQDRPLIWMEKP